MKLRILVALLLCCSFMSHGTISPITGNAKICLGNTITLVDTASLTDTSYTITWRSSNTAIATVDAGGHVAGIAAGTDSVFYSIGTDSAWVIVQVYALPVITIDTTHICVGGTVTMASTDSGWGHWYSTAPSLATVIDSAGQLVAVSPGVVTIENIDSNGCYGFFPVTLYPAPAPISGIINICGVGSTAMYTDSLVGGIWSSTNASIVSIDSAGIAIANAAGTTTIKYALGTASSCTATLTVVASASGCTPSLYAGVASTMHIDCSSLDTMGLSSPSVGCGITYQWQVSFDEVTWTDVAGLTQTQVSTTNYLPCLYRCKVLCTLSGDSVYSNAVHVSGNSPNINSYVSGVDSLCTGTSIVVNSCYSSAALSVAIDFGDNTSVTTTLNPVTTGFGVINTATQTHLYSFAGTYTIREVLMDAGVPVDSFNFSYDYHYCRSIFLRAYYDLDSNCVKSSDEPWAMSPLTVTVDSNGVRIDTISFTSGYYYKATGNPGDLYRFHCISAPAGTRSGCDTVLTYTLGTSYYIDTVQAFSLHTLPGTAAFDMSAVYTATCGRHMSIGDINVSNSGLIPRNGLLKFVHSPKYNFTSATPSPDSTSGNMVFWKINSLSALNSATGQITYRLDVPGAWLIPGDTVQDYCVIIAPPGDADTLNNVITRCDTVKGSWDPNEKFNAPQGFIISGAPLQYTISFQNTGNDTARNIYVLDTLSPNVDAHSLRILAASATMNTQLLQSGGFNIIKFDFPGINLPDSGSTAASVGMVSFSLMSLPGLADSTPVYNHAAIYFDENAAVITDTVRNYVNYLSGPDTICIGATGTFTTGVASGWWSQHGGHATISAGVATTVSAGLDTIYYTVAYGHDTLVISHAFFVKAMPDPGSISGAPYICSGATTTMTETVTGGNWYVTNTNAQMPDSVTGAVSGITQGVDTVVYTLTNSCGTRTATFIDTIVSSAPSAGIITGGDTVCAGSQLFLTDTAHLMYCTSLWGTTTTALASAGTGVVTALFEGSDTAFYVVRNICGSDTAFFPFTIITYPFAGILSGFDSLCIGTSTTILASMPGGTWSLTNTNALQTSGVLTGQSVGLDTVQYLVTNMCGSDSVSMPVFVQPAMNAGSVSGASTLCRYDTTTLMETVSGGAWSVTPATGASVSADGVIMGLLPGNDTIVYTVISNCGSVQATRLITILPLPNAGLITGADTVCTGSQITLSDSGTPGGAWMHRGSGIAVSAGVVTGVTQGTDSVAYISTNSCGADTAWFALVVFATPNPMITALPPDPLCLGVTVSVGASPLGGAWILSNDTVATLSGLDVTGVLPGTDTITYRYTDLCGTKQSTSVIYVDKTPVVSISGADTLCIGHASADTLTVSPTGGNFFLTNTNAAIVGNILTGVHAGIDTVIYARSNACGTGFDTVSVYVRSKQICDSISYVPETGANGEALQLYPNPAGGYCRVVLYGGEPGTIEVTDLLGHVLRSGILLDANGVAELHLADMAPGTYVLRVVTTTRSYTGKLVHW